MGVSNSIINNMTSLIIIANIILFNSRVKERNEIEMK